MKIVTGSMAVTWVALCIGIAGAADAQQSGNTSAGMSGMQSSGAHNTGAAAAGMGTGAGTGLGPTPGIGTSVGVTGRSSSGPALNNMRANGTSLDMNPDPRAPNVTGKAAPRR
ncbi:hypothetical protein CIC12_25755 [Burkholderia sp. SG-MS1]|uniref:hypothetical protein n=1 Tax=Paraburkholderia sp. SG-MS1 TaxID=2023741 RepID=UPI0014482873|nr:hypothetical protein [Paraburkholderia sp. SG-MS1]NKJ50073.1 hypothetical protein [Paraburkholderia sp. SG-MS1]